MNKEKTDQEPNKMSREEADFLARKLGKLGGRESGVTAIEYALLASLIAMVILGSVTTAGETLQQLWLNVADKVSSAV